MGVGELQPLVAEFIERYVGRGRCPADDLLAAARRAPRSWWDGTGEVPEWIT
jgi:hypothetical protein